MIVYNQFYPRYFDEDDVEQDIQIIRSTDNYAQYKRDGGFLDKLTYFEALSSVRENRKRPQSNRLARERHTVVLSRKAAVRDSITGQEYIFEPKDRIKGYLS